MTEATRENAAGGQQEPSPSTVVGIIRRHKRRSTFTEIGKRGRWCGYHKRTHAGRPAWVTLPRPWDITSVVLAGGVVSTPARQPARPHARTPARTHARSACVRLARIHRRPDPASPLAADCVYTSRRVLQGHTGGSCSTTTQHGTALHWTLRLRAKLCMVRVLPGRLLLRTRTPSWCQSTTHLCGRILPC